MTEKLYYIDSFLSEFDASVVSCKSTGDNYEIVLDKTAFFPEGGGQGADTGFIDEIEIFDVRENDGEVIHYANSPIEAGTAVHGVLDFSKRFERMQCHSGEHIVSGLIHRLYGLENVGFHLGDADMTIDINGMLTESDLRRVEKEANFAVAKDIEIRTFFPSQKEAAELPYRSKIEIADGLRLVEIPGYDICACCAPHVHTTGQIGIIKLLDFAAYKGGLRIHMACGMRALCDYQAKYAQILRTSNLLSASQDKIADAANRLLNECDVQKHEIAALRHTLAERILESAAETDGNLLFFEPMLDSGAMRLLANGAIKKCNICAVFAGSDTEGYNYCIASDTTDMRAFGKDMNTALSGRGGGSEQMLTGKVNTNRKAIENYFQI